MDPFARRRTFLLAGFGLSILVGGFLMVDSARRGLWNTTSVGVVVVMALLALAVAVPVLLTLRAERVPLRLPNHGRYFRPSSGHAIGSVLILVAAVCAILYVFVVRESFVAPILAGATFACGVVGLMYTHRFGYFVDENERPDAKGDPPPYRY
ncbi:MAG TPA: hypothetical protein VM681_10020 [Candidatus Thermoplasmatota archaeon]|nr:hypothetical protein [Candidatus Thermoplasmatota archaeon]